MRPLVAGNWKMNGLGADLAQLAALKARLAGLMPEGEANAVLDLEEHRAKRGK